MTEVAKVSQATGDPTLSFLVKSCWGVMAIPTDRSSWGRQMDKCLSWGAARALDRLQEPVLYGSFESQPNKTQRSNT